jgi:hypothetical protein
MKCKKCLLFILAFLIVISSAGIAFNVHFCEGTIVSVTTDFSQEEPCETSSLDQKKSCCEKEMATKKCCSDKKVSFKNKTEKINYKTSFAFDSYLILAATNVVFDMPTNTIQNKKTDFYSFESNAPPLYKLYCNLTFYA